MRSAAWVKKSEASPRETPAWGAGCWELRRRSAWQLYLVAVLLPNGTLIAGISLAGIGLVLLLVGYGVGAYAAFCEDTLNGFLYLFIPLYTGYYLVSNWDEMWRWFLLSSVGVVILALAVMVMEAGVEKADAEKARRDAPQSWSSPATIHFALAVPVVATRRM